MTNCFCFSILRPRKQCQDSCGWVWQWVDQCLDAGTTLQNEILINAQCIGWLLLMLVCSQCWCWNGGCISVAAAEASAHEGSCLMAAKMLMPEPGEREKGGARSRATPRDCLLHLSSSDRPPTQDLTGADTLHSAHATCNTRQPTSTSSAAATGPTAGIQQGLIQLQPMKYLRCWRKCIPM